HLQARFPPPILPDSEFSPAAHETGWRSAPTNPDQTCPSSGRVQSTACRECRADWWEPASATALRDRKTARSSAHTCSARQIPDRESDPSVRETTAHFPDYLRDGVQVFS